MYAYLEDQTCERSVVVVLFDTINQELRKRRHDLSVLAKSRVLLAKDSLLDVISALWVTHCARMSLFPCSIAVCNAIFNTSS
jgi:hypothetical protein